VDLNRFNSAKDKLLRYWITRNLPLATDRFGPRLEAAKKRSEIREVVASKLARELIPK
jgi:hypothetical protein